MMSALTWSTAMPFANAFICLIFSGLVSVPIIQLNPKDIYLDKKTLGMQIFRVAIQSLGGAVPFVFLYVMRLIWIYDSVLFPRAGKEQEVALRKATERLAQAEFDVQMYRERWLIDPSSLVLDDFIVEGGEGKVYSGRWMDVGGDEITCAIKLMFRDPMDPSSWAFSKAETKAMQCLRGSRIVQFFGVGVGVLCEEEGAPPYIRACGDDDVDEVWDYVVVELMPGGSLADQLKRARRELDLLTGGGGGGGANGDDVWPWDKRMQALCDVAKGMVQMHAKHYVHRDLPVKLLQSNFTTNARRFSQLRILIVPYI